MSLERHQVEVVRRVLEDPIQRYLLADEVGLGKTIEAGIILRQFLLDQPDDHQVVVIAPEALIDQWINELRERCQIGAEFGHSIKFISIETVTEKLDELEDMHADFLIIDEYQAVIGWDHSDNDSLQLRYKALSHFSNSSENKAIIAFISDLVRRNEDGFLALLHLLDPSVYDLSQIDAFRTKVENRQDLLDKFYAFTEDQMSLFLEGMVNDLGEMFPNDSRLLQVLEELKPSLELDVDENSPERRSAIRAVRVHLSVKPTDCIVD